MKVAAGQWTCEKSCSKQMPSGVDIQLPLRVSSVSSTSTGCWDPRLFWAGNGLCSLPSQSWKNFTAEGSPLGLRCNVFPNAFCIHCLMALDHCHCFRSSVSLRVMFEHQAQATESWSFHIPIFFLELQEFTLIFEDRYFVSYSTIMTCLDWKESSHCLLLEENICRKCPSNNLISIPKILHLVLILQNPIPSI